MATARKLDIKLGVILRLWLYIVCKRRIFVNLLRIMLKICDFGLSVLITLKV